MSEPRTSPGLDSGAASEGGTQFFAQSSWLVLATGLSGLVMFATQVVAQVWPDTAEYALFLVLLRVYILMGIPAIGLQTVFAQQTAAALTPEQRSALAGTARTILRTALLLWLAAAVLFALSLPWWMALLGVHNPGALWATLGLGLACLLAPVLRGVLQGRQRFGPLGAAIILDAVGRFAVVGVLTLLGTGAAGGMSGALLGQVAALAFSAWMTRDLFTGPATPVVWGPWLRRVVPLTAGLGTLMIMSSADVVYAQMLFASDGRAGPYARVALVGIALMAFTTPVATVMFPKVARSAALRGKSRAMPLALGATAAVGAVAALVCTFFPGLLLRLLFFRNPAYWDAAPLVPWFAWALLPLMLSLVLINNLLAQSRYRVVPWIVATGVVYLATLALLRGTLSGMSDAFDAFRALLGVLGACNTLLLAIAIAFTVREGVPVAAAAPSV